MKITTLIALLLLPTLVYAQRGVTVVNPQHFPVQAKIVNTTPIPVIIVTPTPTPTATATSTPTPTPTP